MTWGFVEGQLYNRRADIHGRFNGQQQGGIITPGNATYPIFIITGDEGATHGYADRQRDDGVFEYFGEGQIGDMKMSKGNLAIRSHAEAGRDLLLFRKAAGGLRFLGQFVFENFHTRTAPDTEETPRQAIVFELRPIDAVAPADNDFAPPDEDTPLVKLRERALEAARSTPRQGQRLATVYERSKTICEYVFARANGICEHCEQPAPFTRSNGTPYLEAHHIRRLTDGGPDDPRTMIGVCPNCHRRAHSGDDRKAINERMKAIIDAKEAALA